MAKKKKSRNRLEQGCPKELKENATSWVLDRVDNREPLMFSQFVAFMRDLEFDMPTNVVKRCKAVMTKQYQLEKRRS